MGRKGNQYSSIHQEGYDAPRTRDGDSPMPSAETEKRSSTARWRYPKVDNKTWKNSKHNVTAKIKLNENSSHLLCMYTNVDSLFNKKEELLARVNALNPDIIGITEVLPKYCKFDLQQS